MSSPSSSGRITLGRSLALVWRTLRSMRTALVLLLMLALASVAGSLVPQIPNSPLKVTQYLAEHPFWGEVWLRTGMFDVFGSWWFSLIVVLLFTSLVACLLPRSRAAIRSIRQRPIQARELDAFPLFTRRTVPADPAAAIASAGSVLRRKRFRVALDGSGTAVAAEKGTLREVGSLVFHWAFVLLLIGVVIGKGTGYSGRATIAEGQTWIDAAANYDGTLRAGRFFTGHNTGAGFRLIDFEDRFRSSGIPMDFVSTIELRDPNGNVVGTQEVRVNHPVVFDGLRIFQYGFGWAPVLRVQTPEGTIAGGPLILGQETAPTGVSQLAMPWIGVLKLPSLRPQVAVQIELWPDSAAYLRSLQTGVPQPMIAKNAPIIRYTVWQGRLFDLSRSLTLDTTGLRQVGSGVLGGGQTVDLLRGCVVAGHGAKAVGSAASVACPAAGSPPALAMTFPDLRQYSVFQVTKDVGVPIVLVAAILVLLGLLPALYTSRRKLWVRAEPGEGGTQLTFGGFALQRKAQYEEEFAKVVDAVVRAAGGDVTPAREMVGTS
ncbi:MAG: cytochrome c biogenesis protein ResB [Actinomycetota bacterium]